MRLTERDLRDVYLFESETVESGYVGTTEQWNHTDTVRGCVRVAENKITAEIYGERVQNMLSVLCLPNCGITENTRLSLSDRTSPAYKVVSIKPYYDHTVILAEKLTLETYKQPETQAVSDNEYSFYPR